MDYYFDDDEMETDSETELDSEMENDSDETELEDRSELASEASYICNSCGEEIVVPLDYSEGQQQEYVEDCPVCCNPNVIFVDFDPDGEARIWSRAEQDP